MKTCNETIHLNKQYSQLRRCSPTSFSCWEETEISSSHCSCCWEVTEISFSHYWVLALVTNPTSPVEFSHVDISRVRVLLNFARDVVTWYRPLRVLFLPTQHNWGEKLKLPMRYFIAEQTAWETRLPRVEPREMETSKQS